MLSAFADLEEDMDMGVFRELRDFVVLDLTMRNGKRAGVIADVTLEDVAVSTLLRCNYLSP
jgi:hypothetical protein